MEQDEADPQVAEVYRNGGYLPAEPQQQPAPQPEPQSAPAEPSYDPAATTDQLLESYRHPHVIGQHPAFKDRKKFKGDESASDYGKMAGGDYEEHMLKHFPDEEEAIKKGRPVIEQEATNAAKRFALQQAADKYKGLFGQDTKEYWLQKLPFAPLTRGLFERDLEKSFAAIREGKGEKEDYERVGQGQAEQESIAGRGQAQRWLDNGLNFARMGGEFFAAGGAGAAGGRAGGAVARGLLGARAASLGGRAAIYGAEAVGTGGGFSAAFAPGQLTVDLATGKSGKEIGKEQLSSFFDNVAFAGIGNIMHLPPGQKGLVNVGKELGISSAKLLVAGELSADAKHAIGLSDHAGPLTVLANPESTPEERSVAAKEFLDNAGGILLFELGMQGAKRGYQGYKRNPSEILDAAIGQTLLKEEMAKRQAPEQPAEQGQPQPSEKPPIVTPPPTEKAPESLPAAQETPKPVEAEKAPHEDVKAVLKQMGLSTKGTEAEARERLHKMDGGVTLDALDKHSQTKPPEPAHAGLEVGDEWKHTGTKFEDAEGRTEFKGKDGRAYRIEANEAQGGSRPRMDVRVLTPEGQIAGHVGFDKGENGKTLTTSNPEVDPAHRGNNLAKAMYDFAKEEAGKLPADHPLSGTITRSKAIGQSKLGTALWESRSQKGEPAAEKPQSRLDKMRAKQAELGSQAPRTQSQEGQQPVHEPKPKRPMTPAELADFKARMYVVGIESRHPDFNKHLDQAIDKPNEENIGRATETLEKILNAALSKGIEPSRFIHDRFPRLQEFLDTVLSKPENIPHNDEVKNAISQETKFARNNGVEPASVRRNIEQSLQSSDEAARTAHEGEKTARPNGQQTAGLPEDGGSGLADRGRAEGAAAGGREADGNELTNPLPESTKARLKAMVAAGDRVAVDDLKQAMKGHYTDAEIKVALREAGKFPEGVVGPTKRATLRGTPGQMEGNYRKYMAEQHLLSEVIEHETAQAKAGGLPEGAAQEAFHSGQAAGVSEAKTGNGHGPVLGDEALAAGEHAPGATDFDFGESAGDHPSGTGGAVGRFISGESGAVDLARIADFIKKTLGVKDLADDVNKAFAPGTRGADAKRGAGILRENLAVMARSKAVAQKIMKAGEKFFDNHIGGAPDEATRNARFLEFTDAVEGGKINSLPEGLRDIAQAARTLIDGRTKNVTDRDLVQTTIDDYMSHLWKRPGSNLDPEAIGHLLSSRRPMAGKEGFRRERTLPTYRDGIEAGLEPVDWNPARLVLESLEQVDKSVMAHDVRTEMKEKGLQRFIPLGANPPENWVRGSDRADRVFTPNQQAGGPVLRGHYYYPEPVARILDNYLQPGLRGNKMYDVVREFGNVLNSAQLGFGAFHAGFVTMDTITSAAALGLQQTSRGDFLKSSKTLVGAPFAPFKTFLEGSKMLKEYYAPGSQGAEVAATVRQLEEAGGRAHMDAFYKGDHLQKLRDAFQSIKQGKGGYGGLLYNALPAVSEALSKPVMEGLVPRMKMGVFADMARYEMDRLGPNASSDQRRAALGKAWDSVENRLGQMTYDNLFWNRAGKDLAMVGVRSVGWNLGTARELGGAVKDIPQSMVGVLKGEGISPRLAYAVALPMVAAAFGAMYHYLATGKGPDELKDYFFPQNGRKNKDGSPGRVSLPSYIKDMAHVMNRGDEGPMRVAQNVAEMGASKLHPAISLVGEMLFNKDFYGAAIRNPNDRATKQALDTAKHLIGAFEPFSVRGMVKNMQAKEPLGQMAQPLVGITPAPSYVNQSWQKQRAIESSGRRAPTPLQKKAIQDKRSGSMQDRINALLGPYKGK